MFTNICINMTGKPYLYREFICDKESDVPDLPTEKDKIAIGSKALIVESKKVYILNNVREWKELLDYTATSSGVTSSLLATDDGMGNVIISYGDV